MMTLRKSAERALIRMIARNLEGTPSANEIGLVAAVYVDDFEQRGLTDADAGRVTAAFESLGPKLTRFPSPAHVLSVLPPREPPKQITHQLTDAERERNLERLHKMMEKAGFPREIPPEEAPSMTKEQAAEAVRRKEQEGEL